MHQIICTNDGSGEKCLLKQFNESRGHEQIKQERLYVYIAIASFPIAKTCFIISLLFTVMTSRTVLSQLGSAFVVNNGSRTIILAEYQVGKQKADQ
jgi:hypothetical protein